MNWSMDIAAAICVARKYLETSGNQSLRVASFARASRDASGKEET
jgi:hypothetical protein